jgi:hypothetical protein
MTWFRRVTGDGEHYNEMGTGQILKKKAMKMMSRKLLGNHYNTTASRPGCARRRTELSGERSALCRGLATLVLLVAGVLPAPAQPQLEARLGPAAVYRGSWPSSTNYAYDVKVAGPYAYVALPHDGLAVLDVSHPANCVRVGGYANLRTYNAHNVAVTGNYACLLDSYWGPMIIDVSNPTNCVLAGSYYRYNDGLYRSMALAGHYLYVTLHGLGGDNRGLQIFDVSDPTNCVLVGGCGPNWSAYGVAVAGNYAYVTEQGGLQVVDVSNPTNCVWVSRMADAQPGWGVAVAGNYVFASFWSGGLQVIDVSNPTNCVRVGFCPTRGVVRTVELSGKYAYLTEAAAGVEVIDVSNPTNCVLVWSSQTNLIASGMTLVGNRMYVAAYDAGLQVLDWLPHAQITVRVDALTNAAFTLEACTNLANPVQWTPLLTTNVATMPFDYVDRDALTEACPQKFYRVHQP